jgi:hypothetical protein
VRTLTAMSLERLDDLPHHSEQLLVAIDLTRAVMLRAPVPIERPTDPSLRELLLPQGPPDGFHRPTATLKAIQLSCAALAHGWSASFRIRVSNARSGTSLFSLEFIFWSS